MQTQILLTFSEEEFRTLLVETIKQAIIDFNLNKEEDKLMTCKETAKFLRISLRTLNKYKDLDKIPFHRIGCRVLFSKKEVGKALFNDRI
jgi:excisionase family DNA binding protein